MSTRSQTGAGKGMPVIPSLLLVLSIIFATGVNAGQAIKQSPGLGQKASAELVKSWDWSVYPDGEGLPAGSGTVAEGKLIFEQQCVICHGSGGVGASADELAGSDVPLDSELPDKTIGSYWPYATTLFDFIRRAMPMNAPFSLSADQVYALSAYLLHINGVIDETQVLDQDNLAGIKMPNRDGFVQIYKFGGEN